MRRKVLTVGSRVQVLKDKHWLTSPPYWARFFATYIAAVALVWASYLSFHMYSAFVACFTLQVILAALISLAAGPAHLQRLWFMFLVSIIAGKAVWVSSFIDLAMLPVRMPAIYQLSNYRLAGN
jgi:hypothetical protein